MPQARIELELQLMLSGKGAEAAEQGGGRWSGRRHQGVQELCRGGIRVHRPQDVAGWGEDRWQGGQVMGSQGARGWGQDTYLPVTCHIFPHYSGGGKNQYNLVIIRFYTRNTITNL